MNARAEPVRSNVVAFGRPAPDAAAIEAEAALRVARLGYDRWLARERVLGAPVPAPIRDLKLQIEFAASALKRLDPPPENFRADHFWPG